MFILQKAELVNCSILVILRKISKEVRSVIKMNRTAISDKEAYYNDLLIHVDAIIDGEHDSIANMANVAALIYNTMEKINWSGFYLFKNNQLVLGPFQGKPACIRIEIGKGVCGKAAQTRQVQCIENVHTFPGHIACDDASKSEIVVPMVKKGQLLAVLDIDSPIYSRFDDIDQVYLKKLVEILTEQCYWS